MTTRKSYAGMSPAQHHVWAHNMAVGHAVNIQRHANHIANLPSASASASNLARQIAEAAEQLETALRNERIDEHD